MEPTKKRQRGGAFTISFKSAAALLVLALSSCAITYATHSTHNIVDSPGDDETAIEIMKVYFNDPDADVGHIWIFPDGQDVCSAFDNICYESI